MDVGSDILSFVSLKRKQIRNTADFMSTVIIVSTCIVYWNLHSMLYKVTLDPSAIEMLPHLQRIFVSSLHNTGYYGTISYLLYSDGRLAYQKLSWNLQLVEISLPHTHLPVSLEKRSLGTDALLQPPAP